MSFRRSNQSILKEISPGCSLVGLMLKLKLQYFGHLMWRVDSLEKTLMLADWGQEEKGTTEDKMAGWHHQLDGHEFGWTLGVGDGQGGLACCSSWGRKKSDTTERLNWTEISRNHQNNQDTNSSITPENWLYGSFVHQSFPLCLSSCSHFPLILVGLILKWPPWTSLPEV